ncbi:MAG: DNA polymerase, partial [Candidatus Electryoneaceae bacterium]|nr:DNA polymerase [Candidatus Electryoneaceae bacterium]
DDIHRTTAAWMYDLPPELVTSDIRRHAKEVNFGVLYGMGSFGLASRLGISRKRAKDFIEQYFANFPRVKQYIDEIHENARTTGYVETMMGRRRPMPEINSRNQNIRRNAERVATNTPIQGSAADLIKLAMIAVDRMLDDEEFDARMLMQVHDELVFEVPPDEVERLSQRLRDVMDGVWKLRVPLEVGIGYGTNWLDAHD